MFPFQKLPLDGSLKTNYVAVYIPHEARLALQEAHALTMIDLTAATNAILAAGHVSLSVDKQKELLTTIENPLYRTAARLQEIRNSFNLECLDGLLQCGIAELTGAREQCFFSRKLHLFIMQHARVSTSYNDLNIHWRTQW